MAADRVIRRIRIGARKAVRRGIVTLRRIDTCTGRLLGRRTVLVEARTPMNLAVLRPVFEPLLADPRVRVRFTGPERRDLAACYGELDIRAHVISRRRAAWTRVDLYMNADPWEAVPLRRAGRQINFFHGVAGKYDLDCPTGLPLGLGRYDRVAFPNEGRRQAYIAAGLVDPTRAVLVGYPKADALATRDRRAAPPALGLTPGRPTALFAPTFSPASALNHAGEAIVETLLSRGCNVVVKLHDRSLDPDARYTGGVDWRERFARFAGPSFHLASGADSTPYLVASDLMVTDHSSIAFEFCILDRPVIVWDAPGLVDAARINRQKVALLRSAARVVSDTRELAEAVHQALAAGDEQSSARQRIAREVFHDAGRATDRALALVYELLDLRRPRDAATFVPVVRSTAASSEHREPEARTGALSQRTTRDGRIPAA